MENNTRNKYSNNNVVRCSINEMPEDLILKYKDQITNWDYISYFKTNMSTNFMKKNKK